MENKVYFAKTNDKAIIPSKREEDACYDFYACPFSKDIIIRPHETIMVDTGIATAFDCSYFLKFFDRGSLGSKGIQVNAGVIDSGYRYTIFVALTNVSSKIFVITNNAEYYHKNNYFTFPYEKAICQGAFLPVPKMVVSEIDYDSLKNIKSDRGIGKLGSSGK